MLACRVHTPEEADIVRGWLRRHDVDADNVILKHATFTYDPDHATWTVDMVVLTDHTGAAYARDDKIVVTTKTFAEREVWPLPRVG